MEKDTAKVYKLYFPISFCKFKDDVSRFGSQTDLSHPINMLATVRGSRIASVTLDKVFSCL